MHTGALIACGSRSALPAFAAVQLLVWLMVSKSWL